MTPDPTSDTAGPLNVLPALYPLDDFYARAGMPLPRIEVLAGEMLPEPYRSLLMHSRDMTPTLEAYHGSLMHLHILRSEPRGNFYFREVVLRLDTNDRPVEFGANKISLNLYSPTVRQLILQERLPLGHILKEHQVPHQTYAKAFFRVESDALISRALGLDHPCVLYGRRATIWDSHQRPLSEIVEILPPTEPR
jgi:chorismate-pyruvate lyase